MEKSLKFIMVVFVLCVFSCNINKTEQEFKSCTIIIRSPGQCVQKIDISYNGNLKYIVGGVKSYTYQNEFTKLDYIKESYSFKLNDKDNKFINELISKLNKTNKQGHVKKDAFHFELFVDDKVKVNTFGDSPENLLLILEKVKFYVPNVDFACW